jgi:hypothetical protein
MLVNKYLYNFIGKNSRLCEYCFDSIFWAGFTDWLAKLGSKSSSVKSSNIVHSTGRKFKLKLGDDGFPAELENADRNFGMIAFHFLDFNDENYMKIHQFFARTRSGIMRLLLDNVTLTPSQLYGLLSLVQDVVEIIQICNIHVVGNSQERLSGALKFSCLKNLWLFTHYYYEDYYYNFFQDSPLLETTSLVHNFDIIQGKIKLEKLVLNFRYYGSYRKYPTEIESGQRIGLQFYYLWYLSRSFPGSVGR